MKPHVLFVCNRNSGRSLMAEALFQHMIGPHAECSSAGIEPAQAPDPTVAAAMAEIGVPLVSQPKEITGSMTAKADRLIAMGCSPVPDRATDVWDLPDPAGKSLEEVRKIRDQIKARLGILIIDLGVARPVTRHLESPDR